MGDEHASFGPFLFDRGNGTLLRSGKPVAIGQRGIALLQALLDGDGIVGKAVLIEAGWPGIIVEEGNLTVQVAALRKALGPRGDGQEWIVTVPRVGYRLLRGEMPVVPTAAGKLRPPAIAVMPFDNLSGDAGQDYFADGVVEDLITALSRFRSFAVVGRNSTFRYKGQAVDLRDVARELGVRYVLEGSVRRSGSRLRITAHLADGGTGEHLWGQTFDGVVADIFDVQDHIAEKVVGLIEPQVRRAEIERSRRKRPESLDAYDLVLQAWAVGRTVGPGDIEKAHALAVEAVRQAPTYAMAFRALAWALQVNLLFDGPPLTDDDTANCLDASRKALLNADGDAEILIDHANILIQIGQDYDQGMHYVRAAVDANPNNFLVQQQAATCNIHAGSLEAALSHAERAMELSPNDPWLPVPLTSIAHARLALGDYEAVLEPAERAIALNQNFRPPHWMAIAADVHLGRMEDARRRLAIYRALYPDDTIARIAARQHPRDPARALAFIEALRAAGLPEV